MNKKPSIAGFIASLLILGGIVWFLVWVNTDHSTYDPQDIIDKENECKGGPSSTSHGDVIAWSDSMVYPEKGEMATFEGYVGLPNLTYNNGGAYLATLSKDSAFKLDVTLMIWEGDCENTMAPLPDPYENSDLLIRDNSSKKIRFGDKVRVTGKVRDDGGAFILFVKRIEKLEE